MYKITLYAVTLFFGLMLVAPSKAQAPAPTPAPLPDAMPFDIPYGTPISLDRAKQVVEAAMAEAKRRNWKMAIAVVDPAGDLVYLVKMDGSAYSSTKIAEHKARSATLFRRPTKAFFDAMESGHPYVATLDGMIGADGGLPINEGGKIIGAVGTSGGTGAQDASVSKAGADTVK